MRMIFWYWFVLMFSLIFFGHNFRTKKARKVLEKKGWVGFINGFTFALNLVMIILSGVNLLAYYN